MFLSSTILLTFLVSVLTIVAQGAGPGRGEQFPFQANSGKTEVVAETAYSPVLDDEFTAWLEETGKVRGMKGVAIAVTRKNKDCDGWTTETKGFGVADRWGTPVDDQTLFSIGSNSKLFTALGIGLLTADESMSIDWDTKIKDILPETMWALQDPIAQDHADLVDILSHRTGLPRHDMSYSITDTPQSSIAKLRYLRPSAEFRQTFQYNNQMYVLASHIISHLTGIPFETYITRNILAPLGMNWTTYNITEAEQRGTVADGFVDISMTEIMEDAVQKRQFKPVPFFTHRGGKEVVSGAGGVISNAKDMATWLQALILSGRSPQTNATVIPSSVIDKVTNGVTIEAPRGSAPEISPIIYGLGQGRYTYQGHEFIEHGGATIGHYSVVTRSAYDDLGVAILINSVADPGFLNMIKWRLLEKSLGLKQIDWETRYPIRAEVIQQQNGTRRFSRPPSSNITASTLPPDELAGVYFNPGYGTLSLCPYPPSKPSAARKECSGVISDVLEPLLNQSAPALVAAFPKIWATHVLLHHDSGNKFNIRTALAFPPPFPDAPESDDDSRPFAILVASGYAEFVFGRRAGDVVGVEGVACRGAWGAGDGVKEPEGEGREGAEVWFDRVA